ncbi:hypothetical protein [Bradyrhizobium sp. STM 3809]|uniref:hypothetical protein n=1 Tax=Bradyrhizobium sp. STM 3809 TaxID=551936 RepID=UPI0002409312|nr:hypothetical protein [Bradyrhizobium sp. STM 3809]CCE01084.1 conserved hypothetical protein [Bradyrhizobium sp. STM 3809]
MSQTICRMYANPAQAASAKAALEHEGYDDVHLVSSDSAGESIDDIVAAITRVFVLKSHARVYAEGISRGGSLVTVHAPFTGGLRAMQILAGFGPIDSGITEPESHVMPWDEATPMSCILQIPVLLDNPTPFAHFWNVPTLSSSTFSLSALFGMPLLRQFGPAISSFGMPLLSRDPAPLSSLLRLPTLTGSSSARR